MDVHAALICCLVAVAWREIERHRTKLREQELTALRDDYKALAEQHGTEAERLRGELTLARSSILADRAIIEKQKRQITELHLEAYGAGNTKGRT